MYTRTPTRAYSLQLTCSTQKLKDFGAAKNPANTVAKKEMAARNMNMAQLVMALAFTATLLHGTAAVDFVVGGNSVGWTIPPNRTFYSNWASANTFRVGDTLGN